jgi:hypothetical protein
MRIGRPFDRDYVCRALAFERLLGPQTLAVGVSACAKDEVARIIRYLGMRWPRVKILIQGCEKCGLVRANLRREVGTYGLTRSNAIGYQFLSYRLIRYVR